MPRNTLVINCDIRETRVALIEEGIIAELQIGDSVVFLGDEMPGMSNKSPQSLGGTSGGLYLYVDNVDETFKKALEAGGKEKMPVNDTFWGDRYGQFVDPYGHIWGISTHTKDMTPEQIISLIDFRYIDDATGGNANFGVHMVYATMRYRF